MTIDIEVPPCPFCGKPTEIREQYTFDGYTGKRTSTTLYVIPCWPCEIFMCDTDLDKLIERWSRRA